MWYSTALNLCFYSLSVKSWKWEVSNFLRYYQIRLSTNILQVVGLKTTNLSCPQIFDGWRQSVPFFLWAYELLPKCKQIILFIIKAMHPNDVHWFAFQFWWWRNLKQKTFLTTTSQVLQLTHQYLPNVKSASWILPSQQFSNMLVIGKSIF